MELRQQRIGVVYKTLQEPTQKVAIAMISRKNETSPTVLRLVEIVKQAAQKMETMHPDTWKSKSIVF